MASVATADQSQRFMDTMGSCEKCSVCCLQKYLELETLVIWLKLFLRALCLVDVLQDAWSKKPNEWGFYHLDDLCGDPDPALSRGYSKPATLAKKAAEPQGKKSRYHWEVVGRDVDDFEEEGVSIGLELPVWTEHFDSPAPEK